MDYEKALNLVRSKVNGRCIVYSFENKHGIFFLVSQYNDFKYDDLGFVYYVVTPDYKIAYAPISIPVSEGKDTLKPVDISMDVLKRFMFI